MRSIIAPLPLDGMQVTGRCRSSEAVPLEAMEANRYGPTFQRNALAPGILLAVALVAGTMLLGSDWYETLRFVIAVLALIVGWFAFQAKHWWWIPVFLAIAVAWNPVAPFDIAGQAWALAHLGAALVSLVAAVMIKAPRAEETGR